MSAAPDAVARELTPCWPPFLYYPGTNQHCPGCGGRHWDVGRANAECVAYGTALPIDGAPHGSPGRVSEHGAVRVEDQLARKVRFAP